jgi:hypothetical protein
MSGGLPIRWFCLIAVLADGNLPAILHGSLTYQKNNLSS